MAGLSYDVQLFELREILSIEQILRQTIHVLNDFEDPYFAKLEFIGDDYSKLQRLLNMNFILKTEIEYKLEFYRKNLAEIFLLLKNIK